MNNKNSCNICKIEFKYPSLLKRHTEKRKSCINSSDSNTKINIDSNIIKNKETIENNKSINLINKDKINDIKDIIKQNLCYKDILLLFSSIIDEKQKSNNIINKDDSINIKTYNCKKCNFNFASRSSLCNHNKLGRCKGLIDVKKDQEHIITKTNNNSGTTLNDILEITINNDNSTNNDNSVTNNITNNNITININPFGCENLDNITTKQFTSIFKDFKHLHKMIYELGNIVYIKNRSNMNFTKNNMNKNIVTYLSKDMEVKQISEREFIKDFEDNIKKLCIELFHIHKNDISLDNLIEYMKRFLLFYDILQEKKINHIELKEQLKSIMDYVFRDEDINEIIRKINIDFKNDKELKKKCLKSSIARQNEENNRLNEYYKLPNIDNKDKKNLYIIKEKSFKENIEDKKHMLEKSFENNHIKKLEKLNNKEEKHNNEKIENPIILKIDANTGLIIDDRED